MHLRNEVVGGKDALRRMGPCGAEKTAGVCPGWDQVVVMLFSMHILFIDPYGRGDKRREIHENYFK